MATTRRQFLQHAGAAIAAPALVKRRVHIALLGDSILDNGAYTGGKPDVTTRLRALVPDDTKVSLLAVDGATLGGVPAQLARLPVDATHLVLSAGGNDALLRRNLLQAPAASVAAALDTLAEAAANFEALYRKTIAACLGAGLPLTVCTIYNGNFSDPAQQRRIRTALALFDDAILRTAAEYRLQAIDLRLVCTTPDDYANDIEPSSAGAARIARSIVEAVFGTVSDRGAIVFGAPR